MKNKRESKKREKILNQIPIFLAKTYRIVDNPQYQNVITWTPGGKNFVIRDIARLTSQIFSKHFKHSNFASFVRQLNMYDFHKIKSENGEHYFHHENFQRDDLDKLRQIKRKTTNTTVTANSESQLVAGNHNMIVPLNGKERELQQQISGLKEKHEDLQGVMSMLVEQNKEIILQNRHFVGMMHKMDQKYRKKIQTLMLLLLFGKGNNNKSEGQNFMLPNKFTKMLENFQQNQINPYALQILDNSKVRNKNDNKIDKNGYPKNENNVDIDNFEMPFSPVSSAVSLPQKVEDNEDWSQFRKRLKDSDYSDLQLDR